MKKYIETEGYIVASATDKQKDSLKEYMKKIKDIKLRVPEEYLHGWSAAAPCFRGA